MDSHTLEMIGIIIVAVITAVLGPTIVEIVKSRLRKKVTIDPIKNEVVQSATILDELDDIRITLEGDRVWVKMYHNGGHFLLTNKSIQKFSVMYESCSPGVSNVGHILSNIPISLYQRSTHQLMTKVIYTYPILMTLKSRHTALKGLRKVQGQFPHTQLHYTT